MRKTWVFVFVVEDPALALGDDLLAELFGRKLISPLAERAFGELLNVTFVDQCDRLKTIVERMLDRHAYQAFSGEHRDRLDAHPRVRAHLFLAALQHFFI